jgi:hypothetical protein
MANSYINLTLDSNEINLKVIDNGDDTYSIAIGNTFNPVGAHTTNTSLSAHVHLTPPTGANKLLIQALTKDVRYTLDGTTPTSSVGFYLKAGEPPTLIDIGEDTDIAIIENEASASVNYQWGV